MILPALLLVGAAMAKPNVPVYDGEWLPPSVSLTMSPLQLTGRGLLGGTAELAIGERRSIGVTYALGMGGPPQPIARRLPHGSRNPISTITGATGMEPSGTEELGVQVREYVVGDFGTGFAVGAGGSVLNPELRGMSAEEARVGPFVALKLTAAIFSVEARGGPELRIRPEGTTVGPAVDVAAGVSF